MENFQSASTSEQHVLVSKRNINFIKRGGSLKAWLVSPHLPTPTLLQLPPLHTPICKSRSENVRSASPTAVPAKSCFLFRKELAHVSISGHWLSLRFGHRPFARVTVSLPTDFSDSLGVAVRQSVLHPLRPVTILKQEHDGPFLLNTWQWLSHTLGNDGF